MNKKKIKADKDKAESNDVNSKQEVNKEIQEEKVQDLSVEEKLEDAENRILRTLAETENLRKRYEREKEDLSNYVISNFAKETLSILDNLQRALNSIKTDELKDNDENISKFVEGIKLTEKQIITIFEKFKIEKVESLDDNFDPNIHQAMFEVESADKEPGTVVEVVQEGYKIGDRLLRPALVGVSKKKS
jgi:molecular chaperone GrpE